MYIHIYMIKTYKQTDSRSNVSDWECDQVIECEMSEQVRLSEWSNAIEWLSENVREWDPMGGWVKMRLTRSNEWASENAIERVEWEWVRVNEQMECEWVSAWVSKNVSGWEWVYECNASELECQWVRVCVCVWMSKGVSGMQTSEWVSEWVS